MRTFLIAFLMTLATQAGAETFNFTVKGKSLSIDLPSHYCEPAVGSLADDKKDQLNAAALSAGVSANIISLVDCKYAKIFASEEAIIFPSIWLRQNDGEIPNSISADAFRDLLEEFYKESADEIISSDVVQRVLDTIEVETSLNSEFDQLMVVDNPDFLTIAIIKITPYNNRIYKEFVFGSHIFVAGELIQLYLSFDLEQLNEKYSLNLNLLNQISHSIKWN